MPKNPYVVSREDMTPGEKETEYNEMNIGKVLKEAEPKAAAPAKPKPKSPDRPYKKVSPNRPYKKMASGGAVRGRGCETKGFGKGTFR